MASEREKVHHYRKGLNTKIKVVLGGGKRRTLHDLIDRSIQIEKDQIEASEESRREKRRFAFSNCGRDHKRFHRDRSLSGRPCYYKDEASRSRKRGGTHSTDYSRPSCDRYSRDRSCDPHPVIIHVTAPRTATLVIAQSSLTTRMTTLLLHMLHQV